MHSNGTLDLQGTAVTIQNDISASDSVIAGTATDSLGNPIQTRNNAPVFDIPVIDPMSYCGDADYEQIAVVFGLSF